MANDEKRKVRDHVKEGILHNLIEPSYFSDVKETLQGRKCWRISGHVFESMSKILLAASGVLSFAAGVYDDKILSFTAGTLSTISLATFQFSLYSFKQHKKNTLELNQLLSTLQIQEVPVLDVGKDGGEDDREYGMMGKKAPTKNEEIQYEDQYQEHKKFLDFEIHEDEKNNQNNEEKPIEIEMTKV